MCLFLHDLFFSTKWQHSNKIAPSLITITVNSKRDYVNWTKGKLALGVSILDKNRCHKRAAHSQRRLQHLISELRVLATQGLIYPPSSRGKISFTRRIAEQASPTSLYKSFFNQRPLRLGADTPGSTTVTPQLLPVRVCTPASFFLSSSVSSSGLSPFVSGN